MAGIHPHRPARGRLQQTRWQRVTAARDEVCRAQARAQQLLERCYPVGGEIAWGKGPGPVKIGTVIAHATHGRGDRLKVQNSRTGKTQWLNFYFVVVEN